MFAQDDAAIQKLVDGLGDADTSIREHTQQELLKLGPSALNALRTAAESTDAEIAARARQLVDEIERVEGEREHDAKERVRKLKLVTLDVKDEPLSQVLERLTRQTGIKFEAKKVDLTRKVSLQVKNVPLRQIAKKIGCAFINAKEWYPITSYEVHPSGAEVLTCADIEGGTFVFIPRPYLRDGKRLGWILDTRSLTYGTADMAFDIKIIGPDIERCGVCSPHLILIKSLDVKELQVEVSGRRLWYSDYSLKVNSPDKPQSFRTGPYSIDFDSPKMCVRADRAVRAIAFPLVSLEVKMKTGEPVILSPEAWIRVLPLIHLHGWCDPRGWCDCSEHPAPISERAEARIDRKDFDYIELRVYKRTDILSIAVEFAKPIEEEFRLEVKVPIPQK